MRKPSYNALCSFVFSILLTSAFVPSNGEVALASAGAPGVQMALQSALNGMRGQTFAGGAQAALPAPASTPAAIPVSAPASGSALTPEVLNKLLQLVATKGGDKEMSASFVNALGLSPANQGWPDRQLTTLGSDNFIHVFIISRGSNPDLVMYYRDGNNVHAFRSTRDGKALGALNFDTQSKVITVRTADEAQKELDDELGFWSRSVDKLLAGA